MSIAHLVDSWVQMLAAIDADGTDAGLVEAITALERLKSAAAAAQARATDAFARSHAAALTARGADPREARRSIQAQVALARRDSPATGNRHVGLATALVHELPGVLRALARGETTEWRATLIAQETAHLSRERRVVADAELAPRLARWGDARTRSEARRLAIRLDPAAATERARLAAGGRRVTIRPAPDAMTYLTALLPAAEGVACFAALHHHAAAAAADPDDGRSRGQVMADEFSARIRRGPAGAAVPPPGVEVHLVMTDRALLDGAQDACHLVGYGPVPADLARSVVVADRRTRVWVRRLFTDPRTGDLAATDARRRLFPAVIRAFLVARDQTCRTPFCGAAIRHADHAIAVAQGGGTTLANGNGRCAACNYVKDGVGWATRVEADGAIVTTTPTGQRFRSRPPPPPRSGPWVRGVASPLEAGLLELVYSAA